MLPLNSVNIAICELPKCHSNSYGGSCPSILRLSKFSKPKLDVYVLTAFYEHLLKMLLNFLSVCLCLLCVHFL